MHEIGGVVLGDLPAGIATEQALQLPRVIASCDAVIRDSSGSAIKIVEAKHRTPFVPTHQGSGTLVYLGRSAAPQQRVTCEQLAQCQFQMLVMDVRECDLISFSLGSSRIFTLQRDDAWLQLALQRLQHMQTAYISQGNSPPPDALKHDLPEIHRMFVAATVEAMERIRQQQHEDVTSAVQRAAMSLPFLDNLCKDDDRRVAVGKRQQSMSLGEHSLYPHLALSSAVLAELALKEAGMVFDSDAPAEPSGEPAKAAEASVQHAATTSAVALDAHSSPARADPAPAHAQVQDAKHSCGTQCVPCAQSAIHPQHAGRDTWAVEGDA